MPSDFPSVNTIVGTKFVDGGIQQGCTVPSNMDDSNFAEESVKRVPISFVYTIRFKTSANENIVQSDIEKDFQNFVFNNYINCEVDNSNRRRIVERARTSFPNCTRLPAGGSPSGSTSNGKTHWCFVCPRG
jgi:hypothetical protein